jgi:spermidine/putrescine transport system substrate-binding protein
MRAILLLILGLLAASVKGEPATLNLFIWSEYIDPEVISGFEKKFDCHVVIDVYDEAEAMLAKLQGGGAAYDVVVASDYLINGLVKQNLLAPLRKENIPNLKNLDPKFLRPPFDPENTYTAAYQWGTLGIYARRQDGRELAKSWGVLFDPALQPSSFVLMDSMRDTIGAALKYRGASFNSVDPRSLKEARDLLVSAKARSAGFASSVGGKNRVLDKSAQAAIVYSGEAARGMSEDKDTYYFTPKEGSEIWTDNLTVLARAPHRDLAEKFINYVLEAEPGAKISNYTQFATPNQAAKKFIKPELLENAAIYPPEDILAKLEFLKDLGRRTRYYDELWTQIKAR